jgi:hypothetical protein
LLSERPGLRGAADPGLITDLAAVHLFANGRQHADRVLHAMRTFGPAALDAEVAGEESALVSCLVAGLTRLPVVSGPVVCGAPAGFTPEACTELYHPGDDLLESIPLAAVSDLTVSLPGRVEFVVWSSTGRRLDGLVRDGSDGVIFLPSTGFRVIEVLESADATRVLLAEHTPAAGETAHDRFERISERLATAAARRGAPSIAAAPTDAAEWAGRAALSVPGFAPSTKGSE